MRDELYYGLSEAQMWGRVWDAGKWGPDVLCYDGVWRPIYNQEREWDDPALVDYLQKKIWTS